MTIGLWFKSQTDISATDVKQIELSSVVLVLDTFQAYLSYFAEALHEEYKDQGITIQCLTPYFISSCDADDSVLVPSSKHYAKSALATLGYSHKTTGCLSHTVQVRPRQATHLYIVLFIFCYFGKLSIFILNMNTLYNLSCIIWRCLPVSKTL